MGKVVFGHFVHDLTIEPKEELGPIVITCQADNVKDVLKTCKELKEVRENPMIYMVDTRITSIANSSKVIIYGDKVRYGKVKD